MANAFGGLVRGAVVLGIAAVIVYTIFAEDEIVGIRSVTIPESAEKVVHIKKCESSPEATLTLPARSDPETLKIAIFYPKWHNKVDLNKLGYKHANLSECQSYFGSMPKEKKNELHSSYCCLASRADKPNTHYVAYMPYYKDLNDHRPQIVNANMYELTCNGYVGVKIKN